MKTFIMIFSLFLSSLLAEEITVIKDVSIYHDINHSYTIDTIATQSVTFHTMDENTSFDNNATQWLKITLEENLSTDDYIIAYGFNDFDLCSITTQQGLRRFNLHETKHISFHFDKVRDAHVYYFRLIPSDVDAPSFLQATTQKNFYQWIDGYIIYILIAGVVLGLILMTAIYNGALYFYNREISFLYYALMQVFMLGVLFFHTGIPAKISFNYPFVYEYTSLFAAFFAVLFARSFLNTKRFLPSHDKVLLLFLVLIFADMLYFPESIIANYGLYSFTTAYFLVVGFLRFRQGYKPAGFFLTGWTVMVFGIVVLEYFQKYAYFDTLLLGSATEAIMLAGALAYKIQQVHLEKEQQKELLVHQSKLASMGEMIGNIAHQWRQPLTHLSYILMNIEVLDTQKERRKKVQEANKQLEFMSQTIDDFKDFYAPDNEKVSFSLAKETQEVIDLMQLKGIDVELKIFQNQEIFNYKNQYKQVLLNLLSNAKEALIERDIKSPRISIMIDKHTLQVQDNAGGILVGDIQKIFEPYFSTKENSSGIGLYMSKMIVEKNMGGRLSVENNQKGALFSLYLATS